MDLYKDIAGSSFTDYLVKFCLATGYVAEDLLVVDPIGNNNAYITIYTPNRKAAVIMIEVSSKLDGVWRTFSVTEAFPDILNT